MEFGSALDSSADVIRRVTVAAALDVTTQRAPVWPATTMCVFASVCLVGRPPQRRYLSTVVAPINSGVRTGAVIDPPA